MLLIAGDHIGECIYIKQWHQRDRFRPTSTVPGAPTADSPVSHAADKRSSGGSTLLRNNDTAPSRPGGRLSVQDDAKLIFGVVFSLRNMVRKLSGPLVTLPLLRIRHTLSALTVGSGS